MNNLTSRANVILANSLSVLAICTGMLFISTLHLPVEPKFDFKVNEAQLRYQPDHMSGRRDYLDLALLRYDLKIDMSDSFHWNVKMIFLYLVAEYTNEKNVVNQVVLWDKIVMRGDNPVVDLKNLRTKYYFFDDGNNMRGANTTLSLHWNVVPNAGLLPNIRGEKHISTVLPSDYNF